MGTITQGKFVGSSSAFKTRMTKKASSGIALGTARKQDLETKAINDKRSQEEAKAKEISRRQKERRSMRKELEKRVAAEETNPNRNTDERRKVVNVGRPDTAKNPMDTRSKLAKQGEIKKKIIDENEGRSMTLQKYHNLPDSLVSAVRDVMEKKNPFAKDDDKKSKKDDDDDDDDDQDKMVGKDGKKTKVDINPAMKMANEELKGNQKKLDKNHNGKLDKQDFKMLRKEEVEHVNEAASFHVRSVGPGYSNEKMHGTHDSLASAMSAAKKIPNAHVVQTKGPGPHGKYETITRWHFTNGKSARPGDEDSIHPKHGLSLGGRPVEEAEQVIVALSDEETARILAKLNEADDEDEKHDDGPEHIVMQLRKAKSLGAVNRPIHFHDGSKVKVASGHVQKALDMHGSFKKAPEKDEFTQKLQASHASFKKAIGAE